MIVLGPRFHLCKKSRFIWSLQGPASWVSVLIFRVPRLGCLIPPLRRALGIGSCFLPNVLGTEPLFADMPLLKYIFCPPKLLFIAYILPTKAIFCSIYYMQCPERGRA